MAVGCLGQPVSQERLAFGFPSLLGPVSGVTGESRSDTKGWMETKWDDESGGWESGQGYTERPGSHTRKSCPSSLKMMKRRLWSCGCLWEPRAECLKDAPRPWLWGQGLKSQDLPPSSVPSSSALVVPGSHHSPASLSGSSMLHPLSFLALLSFISILLPHSQRVSS